MATMAGAPVPTALRLATSMALIQFAIGASNDVADAARDGGRTPVKPIAAGLIRSRSAVVAAGLFAVGGLALAALSGGGTLLIALAGLTLGLVYNAGLSRSALSWVPLTLALPLVPVFAWYGAAGTLPEVVATVLPIAMLAGAGLAIGNGLVDVDMDAQRGRRTTAVALGRPVAWIVQGAALGAAAGAAWFTLRGDGGAALDWPFVVGAVLLVAGTLGLGTRSSVGGRLGWALEAAGIVVIGLDWVLGAATQVP